MGLENYKTLGIFISAFGTIFTISCAIVSQCLKVRRESFKKACKLYAKDDYHIHYDLDFMTYSCFYYTYGPFESKCRNYFGNSYKDYKDAEFCLNQKIAEDYKNSKKNKKPIKEDD